MDLYLMHSREVLSHASWHTRFVDSCCFFLPIDRNAIEPLVASVDPTRRERAISRIPTRLSRPIARVAHDYRCDTATRRATPPGTVTLWR